MLQVKPSLGDLESLITKVPEYPVTSEELIELAFEEEAPFGVIEFYRAFPAGEVFDKDELSARTEQVALLHQQEKDQPFEQWVASEED